MYGALIGDIVGSVYEWKNIKTKDFPLFHRYCRYTDDSMMTIAVADALMKSWGQSDIVRRKALTDSLQKWGQRYPDAGYGGKFKQWIFSDHPEPDFYILLSDRYEVQLEEAGPEYTCEEMNGRNDKAVPPKASDET